MGSFRNSQPVPGSALGAGNPEPTRIESMADVQRGLVKCIEALEAGRIEPGIARALFDGYQTYADVIISADIEARLRRLESGHPRLDRQD